jgi:hypothetical protein
VIFILTSPGRVIGVASYVDGMFKRMEKGMLILPYFD